MPSYVPTSAPTLSLVYNGSVVISNCSTLTGCEDGCVADEVIVYTLGTCYPGPSGSGNFIYGWSERSRRVYRVEYAEQDETCSGESLGRELVTTVQERKGYFVAGPVSSPSVFLSNGVPYTGIR
jgi:hypothetical protein